MPDLLRTGSLVCGGAVLFVFFPNIAENGIQFIVDGMGEELTFLDLRQLQRPDIEIIFIRMMFLNQLLPDSGQDGIHVLNPHIGNTINIDFHVDHQSAEIRMRHQFTQQPIIDRATFQNIHRALAQMQLMQLCVWAIFYFRPARQIIRRYTVVIRQYLNAVRADVFLLVFLIVAQG